MITISIKTHTAYRANNKQKHETNITIQHQEASKHIKHVTNKTSKQTSRQTNKQASKQTKKQTNKQTRTYKNT